MEKPTRVYSSGDLRVEWRPELCTHCENCHASLPEVFAPSRRPWVDLLKGNPEEIRRVVSECPSGALRLPPQHSETSYCGDLNCSQCNTRWAAVRANQVDEAEQK